MAAISLGVGEIEARLEAIRRRLNLATLLRVGCAALAVGYLAAGIVLVTGAHHSLSRLAVLAMGITGLAVVGGISTYRVHSDWLDLAAAARIADRRAGLAERLTTLVSQRRSKSSARLLPVLVAQLVSAMPRWQPQTVAPYRAPTSAYASVAAFLALLLALWWAPAPPLAEPSPAVLAAAPPPIPPLQPDLTRHAGTGAGLDAPVLDGQSPPQSSPEENGDDQSADTGSNAASDATGEASDQSVQQEGELAPGSRDLKNTADGSSGRNGGSLPSLDRSDATKPSAPGKPEASGGAGSERSAAARAKDSGQGGSIGGKGSGESHTAADPQSGDSSPSESQAPGSGSGSSGAPLMGAAGTLELAGAGSAAQTFPLTITSFLPTSETRRTTAKRGKRGGEAAGRRDSGSIALHRQQRHDDALRKAEIPVELEDIVRHVYSARPQP
jgi:hypothetical protein